MCLGRIVLFIIVFPMLHLVHALPAVMMATRFALQCAAAGVRVLIPLGKGDGHSLWCVERMMTVVSDPL